MRFTPPVLVVLAAVAPWASGCPGRPAPVTLPTACVVGAACPDDSVCVASDGVCRPGDDPCLDVDIASGTAVARADAAVCGDGRVCAAGACVTSLCGDGLMDPATAEACDDGNVVDDDACTNACTVPRCGDGVIQAGEACDDDNAVGGDGCRGDCQKIEVCGDGVVDEREGCDDGVIDDDGTAHPDQNPIDGCDACALQAFTPEVVVVSTDGPPPQPALPDSQALSTFGLTSPGPIAVDREGRVVFVDLGLDAAATVGPGPGLVPGPPVFGPQVLRVDIDGVLRRIAGTGVASVAGDDTGDNGPSRQARLMAPTGLVVGDDGSLLILDNHQVRRVDTAGTITTLALPAGVTGVDAVAIDSSAIDSGAIDSARVLGVTADSIVRVGDGAEVVVPNDGDELTRFIDVSTTSDGIVVVTEVLFVDDAVDATFAIRLHRLQGQTLVALPFDTSALLPFVAGTWSLSGVFLHDDTGFSIVLPDHRGARLLRLHDDGSVTTIAGNGLEGCASGQPGPACDRTNDGATTVDDDVAPPAPQLTSNDRPLRLVHRLNITLPGIDDLDPETSAPRIAAEQRATSLSRVARGPDGSLFFGEQPTIAVERTSGPERAPLADNAARIRRLRPDGRLQTVVGPVHPMGPGFRFLDAVRLYHPTTLARLGPSDILAGGAFGRVVRIDDPTVAVVVGIDTDLAPVTTISTGLELPLIDGGPRGLAVDSTATHLVITAGTGQPGSGTITTLALGDVSDPHTWTVIRIDTGLALPTGAAFDHVGNRFLVVDQGDACVRALDVDTGLTDAAVAGTCGEAGAGGALLQGPTNVVVDDTGRLFVADTGNHRVVRFDDATTATVILGTGTRSVDGEGKPAREFPIDSPGQLGIDPFGNLYVTSPTAVREVTNILDNDPDNDAVITVFGKNRESFPESSTFCLSGLTIDLDHVTIADACQDFLVTLHSGH